jgi:hypothetical protein
MCNPLCQASVLTKQDSNRLGNDAKAERGTLRKIVNVQKVDRAAGFPLSVMVKVEGLLDDPLVE